jgi:hypothetical protein
VAGRVGLAASTQVKARRIAVIRALWFTECTVAAIGERLGISGTRVSLLAKRMGLPPRHEYNRLMSKPSIFPPEPEPRKGPKKIPPTPEQIAKVVTAKLPSPVGLPDKAELTLKVVLPRAAVEQLMVRARLEGYPSLAAWAQDVLEREGWPEADKRRRTGG